MTFSTLMVHLDLDHSNDSRLHIACDLAERFNAKLIGIVAASAHPTRQIGAFARSLVEQESFEIKKRMADVEERFRAALRGRVQNIEWRAAIASPGTYVACQARAADLIITGSGGGDWALTDPLRCLDPSDLVMHAGRPIFVVPPGASHIGWKCGLVAWKDTREARRAVADAMPLLQKAKDVAIVEVIEREADRSLAHARVDDVAAWLSLHGVAAFGRVFQAVGQKAQLDQIMRYEADFLVAGAYGHSRLREWVFGGFTQGLLTQSSHCSLLSH